MNKENSIKITLELPPSVNECYVNSKRGRYKSESYNNWLLRSEITIREHGYKISGNEWLEANLIVTTPLFYKNGNKKKQDLDNFMKPLFDCLGTYIPGFKDEHVKAIKAIKIDGEAKTIEITIKELK